VTPTRSRSFSIKSIVKIDLSAICRMVCSATSSKRFDIKAPAGLRDPSLTAFDQLTLSDQ
jgi:hypothetical protein